MAKDIAIMADITAVMAMVILTPILEEDIATMADIMASIMEKVIHIDTMADITADIITVLVTVILPSLLNRKLLLPFQKPRSLKQVCYPRS